MQQMREERRVGWRHEKGGGRRREERREIGGREERKRQTSLPPRKPAILGLKSRILIMGCLLLREGLGGE